MANFMQSLAPIFGDTNPDVDTPQEKQPAGLPLLQSKAHLHHGDLKIFSPWVSGWFLGWVGGAY